MTDLERAEKAEAERDRLVAVLKEAVKNHLATYCYSPWHAKALVALAEAEEERG